MFGLGARTRAAEASRSNSLPSDFIVSTQRTNEATASRGRRERVWLHLVLVPGTRRRSFPFASRRPFLSGSEFSRQSESRNRSLYKLSTMRSSLVPVLKLIDVPICRIPSLDSRLGSATFSLPSFEGKLFLVRSLFAKKCLRSVSAERYLPKPVPHRFANFHERTISRFASSLQLVLT